MSSLIVLCPHCLTWIEIHADCCTECGGVVNLDDKDPDDDSMAQRLGERLRDLGPVKLLRRGWPDHGRLLATSEGLLFLPLFTIRPNGSLEAIADAAPAGQSRMAHLFHWWSIPPWRRPADDTGVEQNADAIPLIPVLNLLKDSPGAFFIQRESIQRIHVRWGRAQIERRPSRSISLQQSPGGPNPRESLQSLVEFAGWRSFVAGL